MDYRLITFEQACQIATLLLRNDVEIYDHNGVHLSENRERAHEIAEKIFKLASFILEKNEEYAKRD